MSAHRVHLTRGFTVGCVIVLAAGCVTNQGIGVDRSTTPPFRELAARQPAAASDADVDRDRSPAATPVSFPRAGSGEGALADEAGRKLANPLSDIWAMFTEFDFSFNNGELVQGGQDKFGFNLLFQPIMPIPLTEDWNVITRPTIPIFVNVPVPQFGGGFDRQGVGLGDMKLPLIPANKKGFKIGDGTLLVGVGPTLGFPTGTNNDYSNKNWEIGPAGVLVYKTKEYTAGVFPQYWYSYADRGGDPPSTSHGDFLYFFWYNLPEAWQVGTAPSITYDHKASSGDAWNVPVGVMVAKTVKIGSQLIKFQFGIEYSVLSEDTFGKEVLFRFNVIPVVESLITEPLF